MEAISCESLKELLSSPPGNHVLLDVSWSSEEDSLKIFQREHISGSVHYDFMSGVEVTPALPRNIPTPEVFQKEMRTLGMDNDTKVILYDRSEQCGSLIASRVAWMLMYFGHSGSISILNGGLIKWKELGLEVESGKGKSTKEGSFVSAINEQHKYSLSSVTEDQNTRSGPILIDARPPASYAAGHLTGAHNISFLSVFDQESGLIRSNEEVKAIAGQHELKEDQDIVVMCRSGMTACSLLTALRRAGFGKVKLYQGGFAEWSSLYPQKLVQ